MNQQLLTFLIVVPIFFAWLSPAAAAPPLTASQQGQDNFVYTVQLGDTLVLIARRYNLSPADIVLANHLANPNLIFPGQRLILPGVPPSVSPPPPDALPPGIGQLHPVQRGETLLNIASYYGVSVAELVSANHLANPDVLEVGQTLQIPGSPPAPPEPLPVPFAAVTFSEPRISQGPPWLSMSPWPTRRQL